MAAENTCTNWISGARLPAKSTPGATRISLTGWIVRSASPAAAIWAASEPRGPGLTLILPATPSRGKSSAMSQMPLVLSGTATVFGRKQNVFEALDGADVWLRRAGAHANAERNLGKIDVGSGDDFSRRNQLLETLPGEDHHIGGHAAGKLRRNGLRPAPCDAPDPVVTLRPLVRMNSGNSFS